MLISYKWLKDYVDVKISPGKLAEFLTMAGLSIDTIHGKGEDAVLEAEVTSNRPDLLSMIGVAREVAALTGEKLKLPCASSRHCEEALRPTKQSIKEKRFAIKVTDKSLCPLYKARVIRGVKIGPSPDWLKTRIESIGLRPVNNVVDITNFCLFETGEPMHAFDMAKISKEVIVRLAKQGEKIKTIDGVERTLDNAALVIADSEKPIAIAGIIGGIYSEVSSSTRDILLEAASFDPISVRRSSRKLAVSAESSYRFERRVDPNNVSCARERAVQLILEIAGGTACEIIEIGSYSSRAKSVDLRYERIGKVLGKNIATKDIKKILKALGLKAISEKKSGAKISIPTFRPDLNSEIDLIEEIARIYGYDKIPESLPPVTSHAEVMSWEMRTRRLIKEKLTALGLDEIITHSLLNREEALLAGSSEDEIVEIKNPLSIEQEAMRPSLAVGTLKTIIWNLNRRIKDLKLFEVGNIYKRDDRGEFKEEGAICVGIMGDSAPGAIGPSRPLDYYDLKGILEAFFKELGVEEFSFKDAPDSRFTALTSASIEASGDIIGLIGEVSPSMLSRFDINGKVYMAELSLEKLLKHSLIERKFKELPKYPSMFRDISIVMNKDIFNDKVLEVIREAGGTILCGARLIDTFSGGQIPADKKSITYRLEYRDLSKTLEEKDILLAHTSVLRALETKLSARQR